MSNELIILICILAILILSIATFLILYILKNFKLSSKNKKNNTKHKSNKKIDAVELEKAKSNIDAFLNDYYLTQKEEFRTKANNILVEIMERVVKPIVQEKTVNTIKIPDENLKSRLIGKDGRNKRTIENLTGTDLIIEKDSNIITISSTSPIRREVCYRLLNQLFKVKSIDSTKIQSMYQEELDSFEKENIEFTKNLIYDELNIKFDNSDVYRYLAKMYYRSSYGQNSLVHIIECAKIAAALADKLSLDKNKAMYAALFHDIGKSLDYELDKNHVELGIEIAKSLNLDEYIINAIAAHHDDISCNNIYSHITKIADSISASRPGARINSYNEYFERVNELETTVNEFDEVTSSYVIKSGRNLRVIVNPQLVNNNYELEELAFKIKKKLESNNLIKKYKIKVTLIKENKYEFETSIKQK